jgi:hypothetical protein
MVGIMNSGERNARKAEPASWMLEVHRVPPEESLQADRRWEPETRAKRSRILLATAAICAVLPLTVVPAGAVAMKAAADPTFAKAKHYGVGIDPSYVTTADFDKDGHIDLAAANQESDDVSVLRNKGNGTFERHVDYGVGISPASVVAADFDADGNADLAVANQGSVDCCTFTVSVLMNEGDGTFDTAVDHRVGIFPQGLAAEDLDGDGRPDLAVTNGDPADGSTRVSVLMNEGDGAFGSGVHYRVKGAPGSVTAVDLTGDGKADLATANYFDDTVSVLANEGDGTFAKAVYFGVGRHPLSVTAKDLNGDRRADLATANGKRSGTISVLKNKGNGTFRNAVDYGVGHFPGSVVGADFNGDRKADLAAANFSDATVSVLANRGNGTFGKATNHRVGDFPTAVAAADLGGNKKFDLAVSNLESSTVSVLINTTKRRPPNDRRGDSGDTAP